MALFLVVTALFPCALLAQTSPKAWYDDNPSADIFYIGTAEELAYLASIVSNASNNTSGSFMDKTIVLTSDIDLSAYSNGAGWTRIGYYASGTNARPFRGTFDGNGHTITNLTINTTTSYQGLFGLIGEVAPVFWTVSHIN